MAYISVDDVKTIRENLKKRFPAKDGWKLSIVRRHYSEICVDFMQAPVDLDPEKQGSYQVNEYWVDRDYTDCRKKIFLDTINILNNTKACYNRNAGDMGADYGDMTYFMSISVGKWDKPFQISA